MIKVGLSTDHPKCSQAEVLSWIQTQNLRLEHGIDLNHGLLMEHHDAWIIQQTVLEHTDGAQLAAAARLKKPVIMLERIDGSQITGKARKRINHPNVVAVIKNTLARPEQIHNETSGRIHMKLGFGWDNGTMARIPETSLIKLVTGYTFASYRGVRERNWDWTDGDRRTIRASFAGTVTYEVPEITNHRSDLVEILKATEGCWGEAGRPLAKDDYTEWMRRSAAVVSPWGYGESCYRDYEAILAGAVLIKPACAWVHEATGIYRPDAKWAPMVRYCKADWSDLPEHIEAAQEVSEEDRRQAKERMVRLTDINAVACRIADIVKASVESWQAKAPLRKLLSGV